MEDARQNSRVYAPGPSADTLVDSAGRTVTPPAGWILVPPGDAALTRRIKATGNFMLVQERRGRKVFSRGMWTENAVVERLRAELAAERATEGFAKKRAAAQQKRDEAQAEYVEDFQAAVTSFLAFHESYAALAERLASAVTKHATPVGSGTVARTQRIPIERRAEAAVIAWMRHQTTGYDAMKIARVRGKRREVRRQLAERSHELLRGYRRGEAIEPDCPLRAALAKLEE